MTEKSVSAHIIPRISSQVVKVFIGEHNWRRSVEQELKDKLFGEIGCDLGFFSHDAVTKALEKQEKDAAAGQKKPIGEYLVEENHLTPEQVDEILKIQDKAVRLTPQVHDNT